jgi:hypothetical protein
MTLCRPLAYLFHAAPSKEDCGTLEKGMTTYPALAWDDAVTSGQRGASFVTFGPVRPSPSLCRHP